MRVFLRFLFALFDFLQFVRLLPPFVAGAMGLVGVIPFGVAGFIPFGVAGFIPLGIGIAYIIC